MEDWAIRIAHVYQLGDVADTIFLSKTRNILDKKLFGGEYNKYIFLSLGRSFLVRYDCGDRWQETLPT